MAYFLATLATLGTDGFMPQTIRHFPDMVCNPLFEEFLMFSSSSLTTFAAIILVTASLMTALLAYNASAATVDVAGVKREGTVNWWGSPAVLNSAGVCYQAVLQIDVAALYLEKKRSTHLKKSAAWRGGEMHCRDDTAQH